MKLDTSTDYRAVSAGAKMADARRRQRGARRLFAIFGCIAVLATAFALMLPALSMTRGDLVCDLEEHAHTKACYEKVLVCEQEEGEGHEHADACYENRLACEIPEHAHTDACYEQAAQEDESDGGSSGEPEAGDESEDSDEAGQTPDEAGTGNEVDPNNVASSDAASDASSASASSVGTLEPGAESGMPAQSFTADLKDKKGNVTLTVNVEAPEGAFPAGTFMKIDGVPAKDVADKVEAAVKDANGAGMRVKSMTAVDIAFFEGGPDGKQIEPARKVQVKITSNDVRDYEDPVLVHVVDKARESAKGKSDDAEVVKKVSIVNADERDKSAGSEDTMKFKADEFSPYVIVELESIEAGYITADGEAYRISASYGEDAGIPEGAELEVSEVTEGTSAYGMSYEEYAAHAESALGMEEGSAAYIRMFDIKIVDKDDRSVKYQPAEGATVDVRIELADADDGTDLSVVHFAGGDNDGSKVESRTENGESGTAVAFAADGFSVYAVVDESTAENARMKLEFYSGDNLVTTVYVKNGDELLGDGERDPSKQYIEDIIHDPGVGALQSGEVFAGWILDKGASYSTADINDAMTIEQIRQWAASLSITEGETHRFDAAICKLYTITYKDEDGTVLGMDAVPVKSSEFGTAEVNETVNMAYSPKDDVHNFEGWTLDEDSAGNVTSTIPDDRIYANGSSITIKGDISFTVNAPEGNWLVFDENGKGGTYNAPHFVKSGQVTTQPRPDSEMTRNGYTFGGWYDTKEHADAHGANPSVTTGKFTFGGELTEKTTLYASWIPNATAPYTVILWGQNVDRTAYEVVGSYVGTGRVGNNIPYTFVNNGDEDYVTGVGNGNGHYTGFSLVAADSNQQVAITPEGDAVLNLHYDRITYSFKFYLYRTGNQNNRYDYANNSGSGSNLNDLVTWHSNQTQHPSVTGEAIQSETVGGRTYYYFVMSAYYGEDISSKWPSYDKITGANNREAVSYVMMVGTKLKPQATSSGTGTVKGIITVLDENILGATNNADGNYVIIRFPDSYNNWRYHIWFETVEGEDYTGKTLHTHNGKTYYEETVLTVRSSNTTDANQNEPKYNGFDYVTRLGQNNSGTVWQGGHWTTTSGNTTLYHLNYVYNRQAFAISYFDGNYVSGNGDTIQNRATHLLHESDPIAQGANIPTSDRNYVPDLPEGEEGYVFEGWYLDEGCTTPYTWTTMPVGGIKVYAKWRQVQYRVFLHPNAGTDPNLEWGSDNVSTSFRVSYGQKISTPTGTREGSGYEFVGWYTDPSMTGQYLYNADTVLNDETVTVPYAQTENTELDKWGNVISGQEGVNSDANSNRTWITKKIDLYAKWRKILDGAGINVVYTADDGKGHVGSNAPKDDITYPDQAEATAQAADEPPANMYFKCWVIQAWNAEHDNGDGTYGAYEDTELTVLPGQQFTVDEQYARKTEDPNNPGEYKYTMQLRAEYEEPGENQQTHIWWFNNYPADDDGRHESSHQDEDISVNQEVGIWIPPTREGYTFLGWARIPYDKSESAAGTEGNPPTGKVLDLTAEDLYLKYEDGEFKLNDSTSADNGKVVTKVAADEKKAYHDMYAVWEKTYTVTVKKIVESDFAADKTVSFSFTANETTYFTLKDGEEKSFEGIREDTTFNVEETPNDDFTTTFTGSYKDAQGQDVTFDPAQSFQVKGDTTIVVTNKRKAFDVVFAKTDLDNGALYGAKFELFRHDGSKYARYTEEFQVGTDTTNVVKKGLIAGDYKLVETVAPDGYIVESTETTFTVGADGTIANLQSGTITKPDGTTIYVAELSGSSEGTYTITVRNKPGKPLPSTGGMGTLPLTLLGVFLVVGAAGFLVARRRPLAALSREWAYYNARRVMGRRVHEHKGFTRTVSSRKAGKR